VITKNPVRVGAEVVDGPAAGDFLAHRSQKLQVPTTSCGDKAAALDLQQGATQSCALNFYNMQKLTHDFPPLAR
jgi:hypothetical protein